MDEVDYSASFPRKSLYSLDKSWNARLMNTAVSELSEFRTERKEGEVGRLKEPISSATTQKNIFHISDVLFLEHFNEFRRYLEEVGLVVSETRAPTFAESEQAVHYLKASDFYAEAEGLERFLEELKDEEESLVVNMKSLQSAIRFIEMGGFPNPSWDIDHVGRVSLSWIVPPDVNDPNRECWEDSGGIIGMKFLPSALIQFAALSGPHEKGKERLKLSGTLSLTMVREIFNMFSPWMVNNAKTSVVSW